MHAPTEEQAAFRKAAVELLEAPRGVIKSTAGAGCGKTTALKGAALDCRKAGGFLFWHSVKIWLPSSRLHSVM